MNLIFNHFLKNFYKFLFTAVWLLVSVCVYSQQSGTTEVKKIVELNSSLSDDQLTAKALYEKAHGVSLTTVRFQESLKISAENIEAWNKVTEHFKNNPQTDLTYVYRLLNVMSQKLSRSTTIDKLPEADLTDKKSNKKEGFTKEERVVYEINRLKKRVEGYKKITLQLDEMLEKGQISEQDKTMKKASYDKAIADLLKDIENLEKR